MFSARGASGKAEDQTSWCVTCRYISLPLLSSVGGWVFTYPGIWLCSNLSLVVCLPGPVLTAFRGAGCDLPARPRPLRQPGAEERDRVHEGSTALRAQHRHRLLLYDVLQRHRFFLQQSLHCHNRQLGPGKSLLAVPFSFNACSWQTYNKLISPECYKGISPHRKPCSVCFPDGFPQSFLFFLSGWAQ